MLMTTSKKLIDNLITLIKKIANDRTESYKNKVNNTINKLKLQRLLGDKTAKNFQTIEARMPNVYMQPKINKESNPGRPIISSINCHTSKISQYVDNHLQPHVQE